MKFYTAKNDLVFKTIMMTKPNILKKIIESILGEEIEEIKILNSEMTVVNVKSKKRIVDILVQIENRYIDVEMNNNEDEFINIRNGTYLFNMINESIDRGESYAKMLKNEYIGINLTYHNGGSEIRNEYMLQKRNGEAYIKNFKIIEINMAKLHESWYTLGNEEKERYKYLNMLDLNKESLRELERKDTIMKEYEEAVKKLNVDTEFRMHVTEEEDEMLVYNSSMELAEERGIEKGIEEGSKQKATQTAKSLIESGVEIEIISKATGLTTEEIEKLR